MTMLFVWLTRADLTGDNITGTESHSRAEEHIINEQSTAESGKQYTVASRMTLLFL